jgi:hypothetical protein
MSTDLHPETSDGDGSDRSTESDPALGDYVDAVTDHWGLWGAVLLAVVVGVYGLLTNGTPPGYAAILLPFAGALALYGYHTMEPTADVRLA